MKNMIICDKCGALIEEKLPEEPKEESKEDNEEEAPKRKRYRKDNSKDELPAKRASLVTLPYTFGVNCFIYRDFDLCEKCRSFLAKQLDKVRYVFITEKEVAQ